MNASLQPWPELPTAAWRETYATLHLWTQIVGKIRLVRSPWLNHSWHVALYVTPRGLTTSPIPDGARTFQIDFDLIDHVLRIATSDGKERQFALAGQSVASFYATIFGTLAELGIHLEIDDMPNELPEPTRFPLDEAHASYDPEAVRRLLQILVNCDRVFKQFRTGFLGKASPVHFFWGSFDLAVTRFSGRRAPRHPGGVPHLPDTVAREAYSHEVSSAGFWPGSGAVDYPAFYSYAYPEPSGFRTTRVKPAAAFFNSDLGEFVLPYDAVRSADDPDRALLEFLQSTYEAAAAAAKWDRDALECAPGAPGVVRKLSLLRTGVPTAWKQGAQQDLFAATVRRCMLWAGSDQMHPAARLQFERVVDEYHKWRAIVATQRPPAPAWWWGPALELRGFSAALTPSLCRRLGLPSGATYAEAATTLLGSLAGQTEMPWPYDFSRKVISADSDVRDLQPQPSDDSAFQP